MDSFVTKMQIIQFCPSGKTHIYSQDTSSVVVVVVAESFGDEDTLVALYQVPGTWYVRVSIEYFDTRLSHSAGT